MSKSKVIQADLHSAIEERNKLLEKRMELLAPTDAEYLRLENIVDDLQEQLNLYVIGYCDICNKGIVENIDKYYYSDGYLCEQHSPTYVDALDQVIFYGKEYYNEDPQIADMKYEEYVDFLKSKPGQQTLATY